MPAPYAESPGRWQFLSSQDGKAEISWSPTPDMANPFGSVHGGIIATLIDESCGAALMPMIETPSAPTVSLNVEYLHPVLIGDTYTVVSEIVRKGRAMAIADARILNDEGTMLVRGTCFFQIPRPK
jgi:acyl-coenzyme A thioesterase 13